MPLKYYDLRKNIDINIFYKQYISEKMRYITKDLEIISSQPRQ